MKIDAHQHFWRPARGDYGWLDNAPAALRRDFLPADLAPTLASCGIDATVLVQAAPSVDETHYLLGLADATPFIAGVVGWIDFEQAAQRAQLDRLAAHPRLVGVRPMVQDIPQDDWVLSPRLDWAFSALQETGLAFDALGFPRHADVFLALAQRYPRLRMVLDHGLKPTPGGPDLAAWEQAMRRLADETPAFCKLSGLPTEAGPGSTPELLRPCIEHLLDCFGADRLIWGSDWPVLSATQPYDTWLQTCVSVLTDCGCDAQARAKVFGGNAAAFYRLPPSSSWMRGSTSA